MQFVCFLDVFVVVESGFLQIDVLKKIDGFLEITRLKTVTRSLDLTPVYKTLCSRLLSIYYHVVVLS